MKGKKKSEKKKGDKKLPTAQQESAPVDNSGTSSAPPVEPKKAIPEKANPEQTIPEQTIPEQNIPKPPKNDKQPDRKGKKTKKIKNQPKKASFFGGLFSAKRLFIYYILSVFFWCDGKTLEQCNSYEEVLCFNGISQYILNHDYFHKFIEPKITVIKQNVEVYGKHALDTASVHAKPYVNPILESAQPHLQTASELSVEYVYIPVAKGLTKTRELYNENAKDHVNKFYHQAVKFSAPYVSQAQEHTSYAYDQALKYNKNNVQPWYNKKVLPFVIDAKDRLFLFYNTKVVPFTYHTLEVIEEFYHEKTVPFYHTYISPYTSSVLKLIQSEGQSKVITEEEVKAKKSKEAADKKAKVEAERKAKEEAVKRAKVEAERKAKEEADKKAKIETERKAKEEADKKAKVEAEKKAKEEADKKAKAEAERKAKEEADKKAKAEAERKAKEEADKKAKAEAERKAKEEADKKAKSESERKKKEAADKKAQEEAAGKAAIEAVNKAVHDAYNREYEIVDKNLTQTLDIYEKEATSVSQELLKEVEDRILTLSNAGSEHLAKLKKFVEQIKKDNTKDDKTTKFNEIKDSAIKSINALKESGKEFIEISENSLNDLEEIKFNELKKNADLIMIDQVHNSRERISKLVDDKRVDERLISEINMAFSSLMAEFNGNKNEASLRVREIFAKIRKKITLLETTRDDLIKNIKDYVKMEKENLKSDANEVTTKEHGTDNKKDSDVKSDSKIIVQNDNKNDDQIPVQVEEKSSVEERSSNIPPVTIQISSDPVLGKLKARRDLVLNKLKEGYKLFKANKGNEPVQSLDYEDEEDEEDEDDDYDEEAGDNECSSGDK